MSSSFDNKSATKEAAAPPPPPQSKKEENRNTAAVAPDEAAPPPTAANTAETTGGGKETEYQEATEKPVSASTGGAVAETIAMSAVDGDSSTSNNKRKRDEVAERQEGTASAAPTTTTKANAGAVHCDDDDRQGTGISILRAELNSASGGGLLKSSNAKAILRNLLKEHGLDVPAGVPRPAEKKNTEKKARKPIETTMSDERVMQLAQEGELSFLASLLKVIEEEELEGGGGGATTATYTTNGVTTKVLIKACCLAVEPALVPAWCDAKEMVMAALYFLSSSMVPADGASAAIFPTLPLIRPIQEFPDLEKRSYEKAWDWSITGSDQFLQQVLSLERVFYSSAREYRWLARVRSCPDLPAGRDLLLLKGSPPAFALGKSKKTTGAVGGTTNTMSAGSAGSGRKKASAPASQQASTPQ